MTRGLVPRCFEAHCDPSAGEWDVVLEDQTPTHARILAARERFHAVRRDDEWLGVSVGTVLRGVGRDRILQFLADRSARCVDRFGDHQPSDRRHLIERYLGAAPERLGEKARTAI